MRRPYPRATCKTQLSPFVLTLCIPVMSPFVLTLCIPVMCKAYASFREMLSCELPAKILQFSIYLSLHILSLSYTTLTIKSHIKYRVHKIEYNYNQIWYKIKANKTYSCKLQLYTLSNKLSSTSSIVFEAIDFDLLVSGRSYLWV